MKKHLFLHIYFTIVAAVFAVLCLQTVLAADPFVKNPDGNYYSANIYGGDVTVAPGVTGMGIDVSHHEGEIDWDKVKAQYDAGTLDFVILRCGVGVSKDDNFWTYNADACQRLKIPFGVYLYSYAVDTDDASGEAEHVLRLIEGYTLSYPVYYDIEDARQKTLGAETLGEICRTFCEKIRNAGYEVGVYSSRFWLTEENLLGTFDFETENYSVWVAEYGPVLNYTGKYDIWQCSEKGIVDGVCDPEEPGEYVDINFLYIEPRTVDHCYVTFDMCGEEGAAPMPLHLEKSKPYGELPAPISDNRFFGGWYTEPVGGTKISPSDLVETAGKLALYAHWSYVVEINFERATLTGGSALAEISKDSPELTVSFKADNKYFLPDSLALPEGLVYTRDPDKLSGTITGTVYDDLTLTVSAFPMLDRRIVFDGEYLSTGFKNAIFDVDGVKFKTDGDGVLKIDESWLGKSVAVTFPDGNATFVLSLPARRSAPSGIETEDETYLGKGDGKIVGLDETMEYSVDGGETFADCPPEEFECGVDYIIRYKANDADFCGKTATFTINPGRKIVVTFIAEGDAFMVYEVAYGDVIEVPVLPTLENCDMEASHWSIDLTNAPIVEDVTVTAVYQKLDGCGKPIPNEAVLLLVAFSALTFVIFKRKH